MFRNGLGPSQKLWFFLDFWLTQPPEVDFGLFWKFHYLLNRARKPLKRGRGVLSQLLDALLLIPHSPIFGPSDYRTIGLSDYLTIGLSDYRFFFFLNYPMFGLKTISAKDVKGEQFRMVFILYPALRVKMSKIRQSALPEVRMGQNGPKIKIFQKVPNHS